MTRRGKVIIYNDVSGQYRWRVLSPNGRIVAVCGEGYKTFDKCLKGLRSARVNIMFAHEKK